MKVGIKYCGGCKSQFDRIAVIEKIKANNKDLDFHYVNKEDHYDFIIVVQGCGVACADIADLKTERGFLEIKDDNMEDIQTRLESLKNK